MRLKAELWDKIQYLFRNYYDRMMHSAIYLDGALDREKFVKAVGISLEKIPVLRSRYVANKIKPYWITEEGDFTDLAVRFSETEDLEADLDKFLTGRFESSKAPQIRINVFRHKGKDTLAFLINHQCFDGGDFKQYLYSLAEIYNDLIGGGSGDVEIKSGTRANSQVYSSMTDEDSRAARKMYKNVSKTRDMVSFPFTEDNEHSKPMIVRNKLDSASFDRMKEYGRKYNSTLNDVLLAAYFRSLHKLVNMELGQRITIPCMIDLRRHIEGGETQGFTNLTCLFPCTIDSVGQEFSATLKKVHGEMEKVKNDKFVGLSGIPLLELAYKIAPSFIAEILIKAGYTNPFIGMSNIGIVDDKRLVFAGVKAYDAFMTGAIKYKPYMQLALTTFRKEMTMTICIYGNASDRAIIEKFFKLFNDEIRKISVK